MDFLNNKKKIITITKKKKKLIFLKDFIKYNLRLINKA